MNKNVMIDIETLGTAADSVVLSIGAVAFDNQKLGDEFYATIAIDSCLEVGLRVEGNTLAWWMEQSDAARRVFSETGLDLAMVLAALATSFDWENTEVWCNGLAFNIPILDTAYRSQKMPTPWAYYNARDYRTVCREFDKDILNNLRVEPVIAHNALEDAKAQALTLIAVRNYQRNCRADNHLQSA